MIRWATSPTGPSSRPATASTRPPSIGPENVVDQARKFKADGAIFNNNWGCKQAAGLGPIVRDELLRQCGVPTLTLACDVIDATFTSRAEIESQLDSFFEMIEGSKAYQERRANA